MKQYISSCLLVIALLVSGPALSGCKHNAPTLPPSSPPSEAGSVDQLRVAGTRVADEARRGLAISRTLRNSAQALTATSAQPSNPIPAATMRSINDKAIVFGRTVDGLLAVAEQVTTEADLKKASIAILDAVATFKADIPLVGELKAILEILDGTFTLTKTHAGVAAGGLVHG